MEGDLRDAAERLDEERERFKSQLGAAHADALRLGAEAAELENKMRRDYQEEWRKGLLSPRPVAVVDGRTAGERSRVGGDAGGGRLGGTTAVVWGDAGEGGTAGGARKRPAAERDGADEDVRREREREREGAGEAKGKRERALRREVEGEREALRRMCNGLAVDLREAVEGRAEAEDEREALAQVGDNDLMPLTLFM